MLKSRPLPASALGLLAALLCASLFLARPGMAGEDAQPVPEDLSGLINHALDTQVFHVATLYQPPPASERGQGFMLLGYDRADLRLVTGVSAFSACGSGLAAGLETGGLSVWGPRTCESMSGAPEGAVALVGYGPYARYAAAVPPGRNEVHLYDLQGCELDTVAHVDRAVSVSISFAGTWLAVGLEDGTVLAGPTGSEPDTLPVVVPDLLGVGFGRDEGVLFAVGRGGQVVLWDLRHGEPMEGFDAGPGPYSEARFADGVMVLEGPGQRTSAWDLAARERVPYTREMARFFLHQGDLFYRTFGPVLRAERHHIPPRLKAFHSPARGMIAVDDLDGAQRCYLAASGERTACAAASDWQEIALGPRAGFFLREVGYRLADATYQLGHDVLLARWVEERGWFLWWLRDERLREYNPLPGHLPERTSILADRPALFAPVVPPPGFP